MSVVVNRFVPRYVRSMMSMRVVVVASLLLSVSLVGLSSCSTSTGAGGASAAGAGDRGERFFRAKCNGCHPGGGQGAGPAIDVSLADSVLERGKTSGRHAVPEAEWDALLGYMNRSFAGGTAPTAVAAAPTDAAATPAAPAPAPAPAAPPAAAPVAPAAAPAPAQVAVAPSGDLAAGGAYYQQKCQKCHPGGGAGIGPSIVGKAAPGVLKTSNAPGRHNVPAKSINDLVAYMVSLGAVGPAGPANVATVTTTPTTTTTTTTTAQPATVTQPPTMKPGPAVTAVTPAATATCTDGAMPAGPARTPGNASFTATSCSCLCPPNAPPAAIPAACQCSCAR
jgi:mono/diheme cytochrome c family protein